MRSKAGGTAEQGEKMGISSTPQTTTETTLLYQSHNKSTTADSTHSSTESAISQSTSAMTSLCFNSLHDFATEISANDIISRANCCYSFFIVLGFVSALFLFCSFFRSYKASLVRKDWTWLDTTLSTYCICEFYVLLFSISSLAHRPKYMKATSLNCAILAFFFNMACLSGELLQALMLFFPAFHQDPPIAKLLQMALDKPAACVALTSLISLLLSVILAGLRGLSVHEDCWLDPYDARYNYYVFKLVTVFILPNLLKLHFLIIWRRSDSGFPSILRTNPVFLAVMLVTFICRLFYSCVIMKWEVQCMGQSRPLHGQRALWNVAEIVLFSSSSVCLTLVLLLHSPCRKTLWEAVGYLRDCCNRIGSRETSSNLMTPHIVITEPKENSDEE